MSKTYYIDTNIILDSAENLELLSDSGQNTLIISETVLSELDAKKTGLDVINYNAREFNRYCEQADIVEENDIGNVARRMVIKNKDTVIHFISLFEHEYTEKNTDRKIINDRRIIETAQKISDEYPNIIVLSNDIAFRTHASMMRLKVEAFKNNNVKVDELKFFTTIEMDYDVKLPLSLEDLQGLDTSVSGFEFINTTTGKPVYGYKDGTIIKQIDEAFLQKQNCVPINIRQKILSHLMLSDTNDIIVASGRAGSGKNLIATSAACALRDIKGGPYEKIVYIRKTVTSVDNKNEDLGFLPGDLSAKMNVYLKPLYNTVEALIKRKYPGFKPKSKDEMDEKIQSFISDYNIQFEYEGFLRGSTISNAVIILDEFANDSISSLRLILTRVGENCKVFILGDINQIDNAYLNKHNNALTFMLNECNRKNEHGINVAGMLLTDTVRSRIAKYGDSL